MKANIETKTKVLVIQQDSFEPAGDFGVRINKSLEETYNQISGRIDHSTKQIQMCNSSDGRKCVTIMFDYTIDNTVEPLNLQNQTNNPSIRVELDGDGQLSVSLLRGDKVISKDSIQLHKQSRHYDK